MKNTTRINALGILNTQRAHMKTRPHDEKQAAYYEGLRDMLEIIESDFYAVPVRVIYEENLGHKVVKILK